MSLPENNANMPSPNDGNDGTNVCDGDGERRNIIAKSFDMVTFQQLRLERVENQRRAEQQKRHDEKSRLRWSSAANSPSSVIKTSMKTVKGPFWTSTNDPIETNMDFKMLARHELLRLGQRYASSSTSNQQRRLTVPEETLPGNATESAESQKVSLSSLSILSNGGTATRVSEIKRSSIAASEKAFIHLPHLLDINSRPSSVPVEAMANHDNVISVVTPVDESISKKDVEVYGSHYLLLARANSSPIPTSNIHHDGGDANTIDADDGSSSASYSTPTPHLQAASACNSRGENDDGCEAQEDAEADGDHFSSFCKAQVLISEIEDKQLDSASSMCPSEVAGDDDLVQLRRSRAQRIASVTFAGAALFFCWRYIPSWYRLTYLRELPQLSAQLNSQLHSKPLRNWSPGTMQNAFSSKLANALKQTSSLHGHINRFVLWANMLLRSTVSSYTNWTKDADVLSWIIQSIYCLEKLYYDALQLFNATKCRFLEVHDSSVVALNATFSAVISCWQQTESAPPSNFFCKSREHIVIGKSTLTTPIIYNSNEGLSKTLKNDTSAILGNGDSIESTTHFSSPQFWRKTVKGVTFIRHQLPSMKLDFRRCIHSIPSLGTQPEGSDSSTPHWHISISPALIEHSHPTQRSKISYPAIGLSRSRLSLRSHQLDSISICSDIRKIIEAASETKSRPQHTGKISQQPSQSVITRRNYYIPSSYRTHGSLHKKDVFDDVDVMSMAREFVSQFLRQRSSNKRGKMKGQT